LTNITRSSGATTVKDLYRYIWEVSARSQVILSALAVAVFLMELAPLELQRRIVNGAVERHGFTSIATLCLIYVAVALVHGGLKLVLNVYRSSVSEAANQRLRMQIDPNLTAASANQSESGDKGVKISIVVSEVEAVGGFVGDVPPRFRALVLANGGDLDGRVVFIRELWLGEGRHGDARITRKRGACYAPTSTPSPCPQATS